jgi:hypothetical protein
MMSLRRLLLLAAPVAILAACSDDDCTGPTCPGTPPLASGLNVVNAANSLGALQLIVDNEVARLRIEPGTSSGRIELEPGEHSVVLVRIGFANQQVQFNVQLRDSVPRLVVAYDSSGLVRPLVVADTGALVPEGRTKLRVMHAAAGAPAVDIWRTQPDFATPTRILTPFEYKAVSAYLQGTPGTWTVTVTPRDAGATAPANPLAQASVSLDAGERATVVLVPGSTAGSVALVKVPEP